MTALTVSPRNALIFILDRSGSMDKIAESTLSNFNTYIAEMKGVAGLELTLVQFDSISTDTLHRRQPIASVPELTKEIFVPRAGTPLIDAACITINAAIDHYAQADRVIVTILTDGLENASRDFAMGDLHDLIKKITGWGWQVVFLGANIDAYKDSSKAGIVASSAMSYDARNPARARAAFSSVKGQSVEFYESGAAMSFTDAEKAAAGDAFIDQHKAEAKKPKIIAEPILERKQASEETLVDPVSLKD